MTCVSVFDVTLSSGTATINSIETAGSLPITLSGALEIVSTSQIGGSLTLSTTGSGGLTGGGPDHPRHIGLDERHHVGHRLHRRRGGMTLSGTASKDLDARTLVNQAAATWTGGNIRTGDGSVLDNPGSLDIQTDADMILSFTPYNSTFTNSGSSPSPSAPAARPPPPSAPSSRVRARSRSSRASCSWPAAATPPAPSLPPHPPPCSSPAAPTISTTGRLSLERASLSFLPDRRISTPEPL